MWPLPYLRPTSARNRTRTTVAESNGIEAVRAADTICHITTPFKTGVTDMDASCTGVLVGVFENSIVYPGSPLCHFVNVEDSVRTIQESPASDGDRQPAG